MIFKFDMRHQAIELICYINHDTGMTFTYYTARSTKVAYPRSQVSVYRTIGPLVIYITHIITNYFQFHIQEIFLIVPFPDHCILLPCGCADGRP